MRYVTNLHESDDNGDDAHAKEGVRLQQGQQAEGQSGQRQQTRAVLRRHVQELCVEGEVTGRAGALAAGRRTGIPKWT